MIDVRRRINVSDPPAGNVDLKRQSFLNCKKPPQMTISRFSALVRCHNSTTPIIPSHLPHSNQGRVVVHLVISGDFQHRITVHSCSEISEYKDGQKAL